MHLQLVGIKQWWAKLTRKDLGIHSGIEVNQHGNLSGGELSSEKVSLLLFWVLFGFVVVCILNGPSAAEEVKLL